MRILYVQRCKGDMRKHLAKVRECAPYFDYWNLFKIRYLRK